MRLRWTTKKEFIKLGVGRETDDEILQRLLKRFDVKVTKNEDRAEYIDRLNKPKKGRER